MDAAKIAIRGSTQDHLRIAEIKDDLVILKDGSVALVIQVSAVNFGLLSEDEQGAIIFAYAGLLNSLNFPIQVTVRSQQKDISNYVALLDEEERKQSNPLLKNQIQKYKEFIIQAVKENNVLDKKFYISILFSFLELGAGTTASGLLGRKRKSQLPLPVDQIIEKAMTALVPKRERLFRQLGRIGLRARQVSTSELVELFYTIYNPPSGRVAPSGEGLNPPSDVVASPNGEINPAPGGVAAPPPGGDLNPLSSASAADGGEKKVEFEHLKP